MPFSKVYWEQMDILKFKHDEELAEIKSRNNALQTQINDLNVQMHDLLEDRDATERKFQKLELEKKHQEKDFTRETDVLKYKLDDSIKEKEELERKFEEHKEVVTQLSKKKRSIL